MQWHPLFAKLLRSVLEGFYEIQTNVPVGDMPRQADLVLVRRTSVKALPFRGLWRLLTLWNVLEFKGPSVSARLDDLDMLVELGLGIHRKLNEERAKQKLSRLGPDAVSFWYLVHHLGRRFLRLLPDKVGPIESRGPGVWLTHALQHRVFLISSVDLPIEPESLPLHLLEEEKQRELTRMLEAEPDLCQRFGPYMVTLYPNFEEIQAMGKTMRRGPKFHLKPLLDIFGMEEIIRQAGGWEYLMNQAIDKVDRKKLLKSLLAKMTPEERRNLKNRLS